MRLKHLLLVSVTTMTLGSACSSDNDTVISNDINTLRVSTDNVKYTINTSDFDLKGDVKWTEITYYPSAEFSWGDNDSISVRQPTSKDILSFDTQGALTLSRKIFQQNNYYTSDVLFYNELEKRWTYDQYYRVTEYSEKNSDYNQNQTTSEAITANKITFIFDDDAKQATQKWYLGDDKGNYSLLKTVRYVLGDDKRIIYPEEVATTDHAVAIDKSLTKSSNDQDIYNSIGSAMDLSNSKKQIIQYIDSKGNIVKSYTTYDIRNSDNYPITYTKLIKGYYQQKISYYDGTSSDNSAITEKITEQPLEVVIKPYE